jgi:ribosomal protein S18 acetylase RimI-like enzyme
MIEIVHVNDGDNLEQIRLIFREYADLLGIDLSFQNFDDELRILPATYVLPDGLLLLAFYDHQAAGCVAIRRFDAETCEMKRLYVRSQFQGLKIGKHLAVKIIEEAKNFGYRRMVLDTLSSMMQAQKLYASLGFRKIPAYYHNPQEDVVFMQLDLGKNRAYSKSD